MSASPKHITLSKAIETAQGELCYDSHNELLANTIKGICPLGLPEHEFISFTSEISIEKSLKKLTPSGLTALIVPHKAELPTPPPRIAIIKSSHPLRSIVLLAKLIYEKPKLPTGIHPSAFVDTTAKIGKNVTVGPYSVVGPHSIIEDNVIIHSNVTVEANCVIGKGSFLHAGAILTEGSRLGFQCTLQNSALVGTQPTGDVLSNVNLGPLVDIGANACIARGQTNPTTIGIGTKIDNLVEVGSGASCGNHTVLCGKVGVNKNSSIGSQVVLGGAVQVLNSISVADGVRIAGSGVVRTTLQEKGDYGGDGPITKRQWIRGKALLRNLPSLIEKHKTKSKE